jgi:hypothetical protein
VPFTSNVSNQNVLQKGTFLAFPETKLFAGVNTEL